MIVLYLWYTVHVSSEILLYVVVFHVCCILQLPFIELTMISLIQVYRFDN